MRIPIDRTSAVPLYRQIEEFLREGILSGSLAADTRLPATRQLAHDLGVNRITVENAYAELEADGLIFSKIGSGTFVLQPFPIPPLPQDDSDALWPLWQQEVQTRNQIYEKQLSEQVIEGDESPSLINLASGIGDPTRYPVEEFRKVIQRVMRRDGIAALEYGGFSGYPPLRDTIAHVLASQGLQTSADNVLITSGSQQAIAMITQMLVNPGEVILVESPTYGVGLDLFRALRLKIVGIPTDKHGMQVEKLEKVLQIHHPKLIYTIPNFHNPTGTSLDSQRRRQMLVLADRHNVPILEDDYVGDLRYEGRAQPALKELDPGGRVIYVSTFSKMLMPGLRVGFLVADGPIYDSLVRYKHVNDLATSNLIQRAMEAYVTVGRYQAHLRRSRRVYGKRRIAMLQAINAYFPPEVEVDPPKGGLFVWVQLPEKISTEKLRPMAAEEGVTYAGGSDFYLDRSKGDNYLRLNFASHPVADIEEGIKRLGKALERISS
jgi:GntR family transcriptional regulator/MocR family aminotransferase